MSNYIRIFTTIFFILSLLPTFLYGEVSVTSNKKESIKIDMGKLNYKFFPKVSFAASITYMGEPVRDLTKKDFKLHEDKIHIRDFSIAIRRTPVNIGIVLDSSGSIKDFVHHIKDGASSFIDMMKERDKALIVKFSGSVTLAQKLTSNSDSLKGAISGIYPKGGTKLYDGIYRAVEELSGQQKCIVLFTDGRDERSSEDNRRYSNKNVLEVVKIARKKKIPIYVIGIGKSVDKKVLSGIAKLTGGKFYYSKDPSKIIDIYKKISVYLNYRYKISYITPNLEKNNKWRIVKISQLKEKNEFSKKYRVNEKQKVHKVAKNGKDIELEFNPPPKSLKSTYHEPPKARKSTYYKAPKIHKSTYYPPPKAISPSLRGRSRTRVKVRRGRLKHNDLDAPQMDKLNKVKAPVYKREPDIVAPTIGENVPGGKELQESLNQTFSDINNANKEFEEEHNKNMQNNANEVNNSNDEMKENFNESMSESTDELNENLEGGVEDYNDSMEDFEEENNIEIDTSF